MHSKRLMKNEKPVFPKRAVITAGMPYGNKNLHFGHVGGMFIHADIFARFLRDRIGKENVIFVSGTDCFGSPILESWRKLKEAGYKGTLEDYVTANHESQKKTLEDYGIDLNFFGASALGEAGVIHKEVSANVFQTLYRNRYIKKLSVPQFFDEEKKTFLNGRQVMGRCPIPGCTSDKAYADECSLGHQFLPSELINPISCLSGKKPVLKEVENWYFDLDNCLDMMKEYNDFLRKNTNTRKYQVETIDEFLKTPLIYVPRNLLTNVFNRLIRSCFYAVQNNFDGRIPAGEVDKRIKALAESTVAEYERHMYNHDFHRISYLLDDFIRAVNKHWTNNVRVADAKGDMNLRKQLVIDCFYACKIMAILVHPIAPEGCEMFRDYLNLGEELWNWEHILEPISFYTGDLAKHELKVLEPRVDFFKKHECQLSEL